MLYKVKPPYNVNALTEQKALEVLENTALFESNRSKILKERQKLNEALGDLKFVEKIYKSDANFLLIKVHDADAVYNFLRDNGVIVRNRSNQPGCFNMLRITIGNSKENKLLINTLKDFKP
jgi:histidinol-phosphate aminotransferase